MKYARPKNIPGLLFNLLLMGSFVAVRISEEFFPMYLLIILGYGFLYAIIIKRTWKARLLRMIYVSGVTVLLYAVYASLILDRDTTWFYAIGMFMTGVGLIYFNDK